MNLLEMLLNTSPAWSLPSGSRIKWVNVFIGHYTVITQPQQTISIFMDHMAVFVELLPVIFLSNNPEYQMMNAYGYLVIQGV